MTTDAQRTAELAALARRARSTLADAASVTLLISGAGICRDLPGVVLHDHDGSPLFVCAPGSPVAPAARRRCAAVVCVRAAGSELDPSEGVMLSGHLVDLGSEEVDGIRVDVIGLEPETVLVLEQASSSSGPQRHLEVPLALYRTADPPPPLDGRMAELREYATRVAHHITGAHQDHLREVVAGIARCPEASIAAASIASLDEAGVRLQWVVQSGADERVFSFDRPARTPSELAHSLREVLAGRLPPAPTPR